MTVREILSAMRRRWYISLSLIACAGLVTVVLAQDGGAYSTRTVVSFMRPATTSLSPTNGSTDLSVIAFAGAVVEEINQGRSPARYSMDESPYYGAGIREGTLVTLVSSGNQWVSTFGKSDIEIQVVGRSLGWVEAKQKELVGVVLRAANARQDAVAMSSQERITAWVAPLTTEIEHVGASRSSQLAAGAAMLASALIVGAWASITADRLSFPRRVPPGDKQVSQPRTQEGTP